MTKQSRRDAAVARLVEAVADYADAYSHGAGEAERIEMLRAYNALHAIDLEVPDTAPIKVSAPLTSVFAGMVFRGPQAKHLAKRILREFWRDRPRHLGFTVDEMEELLDAKHQTISPRFTELRNSGWIVASGETRLTRGGNEADVYVLTRQAIELLDAASRQENP